MSAVSLQLLLISPTHGILTGPHHIPHMLHFVHFAMALNNPPAALVANPPVKPSANPNLAVAQAPATIQNPQIRVAITAVSISTGVDLNFTNAKATCVGDYTRAQHINLSASALAKTKESATHKILVDVMSSIDSVDSCDSPVKLCRKAISSHWLDVDTTTPCLSANIASHT